MSQKRDGTGSTSEGDFDQTARRHSARDFADASGHDEQHPRRFRNRIESR